MRCGPLQPLTCGSWCQKQGRDDRCWIGHACGDWDNRIVYLVPEFQGEMFGVPMSEFGSTWRVIEGNPTGKLVGAYNEEMEGR